MNEFEQRLRRVPGKPVPPDWRAEILAAAKPVAPAVARPSWFEHMNAQLTALLWPHPKAWAGLAAVWIFILFLNVSQPGGSTVRAEIAAPPSPEVLVELREQHLMLVELLGVHPVREADRPRNMVPQPHAERCQIVAV